MLILNIHSYSLQFKKYLDCYMQNMELGTRFNRTDKTEVY